MAFRELNKQQNIPDNPEKLIFELPRRKIEGLLLHQGESMRSYAQTALDKPDVAIQLPTGSGKTLVGLMIAEWRRRKFKERVLYLCPTKQLVHQVVEQAEEKYGLTVNGFTGSRSNYVPAKKAEYRTAERVAVTTYKSLFNTNPFFDNPETIIIDDAHAAENYIASLWSLHVNRHDQNHGALHTALCNLLKHHITPQDFQRLCGESHSLFDETWVDKIPTPIFYDRIDEFSAIVNSHADESDIRYEWQMLRDNLYGCHLYISSKDILLRPIIPPTWVHPPFNNAKQRIFMSATLGAGGDLERLTGRKNIHRLPVPEGWDRQGIGRRFFIFPSLSLKDADIPALRHDMMEKAGRSVMLVPSERKKEEALEDIDTEEFRVFSAKEIEQSKQPFIQSERAVAVMANRYDGIDFPGADCRVLFIDGLPRATNSQENFLMTKMGANVLFSERLQTRVLQAIGRCTRSLKDYSAVILSGKNLPEYLLDVKKRKTFHPELQAELEFGIGQSKERTAVEMLENLGIFLEHGEEWEAANNEILKFKADAQQAEFPATDELHAAVNKEIEYQKALFERDFSEAVSAAESVLSELKAPELKGYRALWCYLAGSACWLLFKEGSHSHENRAREYFKQAKKAASGIVWLSKLASFTAEPEQFDQEDTLLGKQIERIESVLEDLGTGYTRKFDNQEKIILEGLGDPDAFENAHKLLGTMLGYDAGKEESDGSPDPWWMIEDLCFVFEDHANAKTGSALNATKARQTASHPNWIRQNLEVNENAEILSILISPVSKASVGAKPHLKDFYFWELNEFIEWAKNALSVIRRLRRTFSERGDLVWMAEAKSALTEAGVDVTSLKELIHENRADRRLST